MQVGVHWSYYEEVFTEYYTDGEGAAETRFLYIAILLLFSCKYSETSDKNKDTPKEDKPPNKGQAESTHVYILYRKSPLKEDNLSTVSFLRCSTV